MKNLGKYFKSTGTRQKEETNGRVFAGTDKIVNVAKKTEGTNLDEKVRTLEAQLKAKDEELTEKNNTIKCLQEFSAGIGLRSSAVDFYHVKDKAYRQLIEDTQQLYRELEDFDKLVNSDDKSRYEPPMPPPGTLLSSSNAVSAKDAIVPRHYQRNARNSSAGGSGPAGGNSKLANIRRSWEERNLKILDLNDRLKAAYDLIAKLSKANSAVSTGDAKGQITTTLVPKTQKAPQRDAPPEPTLWYIPEKGGVNAKQKNLLLSLVGDEANEESEEEDRNQAQPAMGHGSTVNDSAPTLLGSNFYNDMYDDGEKPEWLNEIGEIEIVPVQAALLYSLERKSAEVGKNKDHQGSVSEAVKEATAFPNTPPSSSKPQEMRYASEKMPSQRSIRSNGYDSDVSDDEKMKSNTGASDRHNPSYQDQTTANESSKPVISSTHQLYMSGGKWSSHETAGSYQKEPISQVQPRSSARPVHQQSYGYNSDVD
ncbi:hypothetical protein ECG_03164 [Echinococcus granulosus]|nr:hypothetical protein ECG_03164 [Echinococcus granulosus]CDS19865.1 expressed conserved protein [Echinococcus granulosus]